MKRLLAQISPLSQEERLHLLSRMFQLEAETVAETAMVIRSLEVDGVDIKSLGLPARLINPLRKIGWFQLHPKAWIRYRGMPWLLLKIETQPWPDQEELSESCQLPVLILTDDGPTERMIDPIEMSSAQIAQVFANGSIRTLTEQRTWIDEKLPERRRGKREIESGVVIDRKKRGIVFNGMFVSRSQLHTYLSHLDD